MNKLLLILLIALYFYMIISSISVLLLENRNPTRSLSWILVMVLLPGIGIFLYLMIGQNYRKQKVFSKISVKHLTKLPYEEIKPEACSTIISETHHLNLVKLLYNNNDATLHLCNKIDVLSDGESTFTSMFDAIEKAEKHIHIQFFIFENDRISNYLRELLIKSQIRC